MVYSNILAYTVIYCDTLIYTQVKLMNTAINNAKAGSPRSGLQHFVDPSNNVVDVFIKCIDWNIATSHFSVPEAELPEQEKTVALLDLLQHNLPDKTGGKGK